MFFYGSDGELQHTGDDEKKARKHVETMLRTTNYRLQPQAAAGLQEILGEVDPSEARKEATRRVRRALDEAGMSNVPFDIAVQALDNEWQAKISVGEDVT